MVETTSSTGMKATRREWIGLAVLALPCLLYSMDLTVLNLAVPHITTDLEPSATQMLWIVDIYGFMVAGWLITMGTLGDRFGRRRLLLIGSAAFGCASVLAAFSSSAETLIAARALLGVAGATLAPSTLSLLRSMFHDSKERTVAIGIWIASFSAGGAVGPLFGGMLIEHFWWGSVFLANVPVMVLLLILGPILLPEYRDPQAGRLDIASAVLSLISVLTIVYGVKRIAEHGPDWLAALTVVAGLIVGAVFVYRQQHLASPLINLRLFRIPTLRASLIINILGFCSIFSVFLFVSQHLQLVLGMSPFVAGAWTATSGIAFVVGSMVVTPIMLKLMRPAYAMACGLTLASCGFIILSQSGGSDELANLIIGLTVLSLGIAPVATLTTDLIIDAAPPEQAGAASGISETCAELGGALGIAILGSIHSAIYRSAMNTTMHETALTGVPPEVAEAAESTLGGAVAAIGQLPSAAGAELLHAGREAFVHAYEITALIGSVIVLLAAVTAAILLRNARPGAEPSSVSEPAAPLPANQPACAE